jgi:hypothetical protein
LQVRRFKNVFDVLKPKTLYAEATVYSLTHDIAGRVDFIWEVEGATVNISQRGVDIPKGNIIVDVKTGSWSKKALYQMAAYDKAIQESLGIPIVATVGIHLKAQTQSGVNVIVRRRAEIDHDFSIYQHIAAIYDEKHRNDAYSDYEFESVVVGERAAEAIMLGQTIRNATAEADMLKSVADKINAAEHGASEKSKGGRGKRQMNFDASPGGGGVKL